MFLINGEYYLDLEPYVDIDKLLSIEKEIAVGIVKSKAAIYDSGADFQHFYDPSVPSLTNYVRMPAMRDPAHPYNEYFKRLNYNINDCRMFARYVGEFRQMGQALNLRSTMQMQSKGLGSKAFDSPEYRNFPELQEWINNLKIFKEIGRVLFWFNAPGEPHAIHKDAWTGYPDHLMLINLHPERKEFFVLDDDGNKHYIKSRAFLFDNRNYHGTCGKDFYSWTIRMDGMFDQHWAEEIGIWDHFDPTKEHPCFPDTPNPFQY